MWESQNTCFVASNAFFKSASVLLNFFMNWAWNVAWCCLIHTSIITVWHICIWTQINLDLFMTWYRPVSICVVYIWSVFHSNYKWLEQCFLIMLLPQMACVVLILLLLFLWSRCQLKNSRWFSRSIFFPNIFKYRVCVGRK